MPVYLGNLGPSVHCKTYENMGEGWFLVGLDSYQGGVY